jgi:voltage-gated potassium channel
MHHYDPSMVDADQWTQYITSLYWAIVSVTTMGYGDIMPVTHVERMVCIGVALTGAVVFSHCMGLVSSLIAQVARRNYGRKTTPSVRIQLMVSSS